jgi:hypothetical protein
MKSETKTFDAVRIMREIRDTLSRETSTMSYEEQKRYMRDKRRQERTKDPTG